MDGFHTIHPLYPLFGLNVNQKSIHFFLVFYTDSEYQSKVKVKVSFHVDWNKFLKQQSINSLSSFINWNFHTFFQKMYFQHSLHHQKHFNISMLKTIQYGRMPPSFVMNMKRKVD